MIYFLISIPGEKLLLQNVQAWEVLTGILLHICQQSLCCLHQMQRLPLPSTVAGLGTCCELWCPAQPAHTSHTPQSGQGWYSLRNFHFWLWSSNWKSSFPLMWIFTIGNSQRRKRLIKPGKTGMTYWWKVAAVKRLPVSLINLQERRKRYADHKVCGKCSEATTALLSCMYFPHVSVRMLFE